jgi:hypothetical protein
MPLLDDFLDGKTLPGVQARLDEDKDEPEPEPDPAPRAGAKKRTINNDEREWLRRLTVEPGWPILMWLVDSLIEAREESAILLSQTDPLTNQNAMVKEWTYIASMKEVAKVMRDRVRHEIEVLRQQEGKKANGEVLGE